MDRQIPVKTQPLRAVKIRNQGLLESVTVITKGNALSPSLSVEINDRLIKHGSTVCQRRHFRNDVTRDKVKRNPYFLANCYFIIRKHHDINNLVVFKKILQIA